MYETTPGESFRPLLSSSATPSTPSADSTPHYVNPPPSLPPPRHELVNVQPYLEPMDNIDAIKASIKHADLPPVNHQSGSGDEYMIMGPAKNATSKAESKTPFPNGLK